MGRQKKLPGHGDERVSIRLTPGERAELVKAASERAIARGLRRISLAAYIRDAALDLARKPTREVA